MPKEARPPTEVLASIGKKAGGVREAAAELTARIEQFQEYLAGIPGRVETDHYGPHPDASDEQQAHDMSLALRLHRVGKKWILSYATHHEQAAYSDPFYQPDFKPLTEAAMKYKIAAVREFPNFLASIEKSQDKFIAQIAKITSEYDEFAATLKPQKEGK